MSIAPEGQRMNDHGFFEPVPDDDTANLKAHISTLQGRIEALERAMTRLREKEIKVRAAVGQLAKAHEVSPK